MPCLMMFFGSARILFDDALVALLHELAGASLARLERLRLAVPAAGTRRAGMTHVAAQLAKPPVVHLRGPVLTTALPRQAIPRSAVFASQFAYRAG